MNHQYRKKPVVIEAFQMTPERREDNAEWPWWLNEAWNKEPGLPGSLYPTMAANADRTLSIGTLEGHLLVSWGDWVIRGVQGELYPCKPDIFAATYEPVASEVPHAAASRRALDALAQMGPEEVRQTFVDAGIVDASGRLTEAYGSAPEMSGEEFVAAVDAIIATPEMQELLAMDRAAPDLPEPCAVCSEALCACDTEDSGRCRGYRMRSDGRVFHCDRGWISVPDLSGEGCKRFACHQCLCTGRAGGGGS